MGDDKTVSGPLKADRSSWGGTACHPEGVGAHPFSSGVCLLLGPVLVCTRAQKTSFAPACCREGAGGSTHAPPFPCAYLFLTPNSAPVKTFDEGCIVCKAILAVLTDAGQEENAVVQGKTANDTEGHDGDGPLHKENRGSAEGTKADSTLWDPGAESGLFGPLLISTTHCPHGILEYFPHSRHSRRKKFEGFSLTLMCHKSFKLQRL